MRLCTEILPFLPLLMRLLYDSNGLFGIKRFSSGGANSNSRQTTCLNSLSESLFNSSTDGKTDMIKTMENKYKKIINS